MGEGKEDGLGKQERRQGDGGRGSKEGRGSAKERTQVFACICIKTRAASISTKSIDLLNRWVSSLEIGGGQLKVAVNSEPQTLLSKT